MAFCAFGGIKLLFYSYMDHCDANTSDAGDDNLVVAPTLPTTPAAGSAQKSSIVTPKNLVGLAPFSFPDTEFCPTTSSLEEIVAVVPDPVTERPQQFLPPTKNTDRSNKRRKTSYILDREDKSTSHRNILLPLDTLVTFLSENFVCKRCHKRLTQNAGDDEQPLPPLGLEGFGLAFGLNFKCDCGAKASLRPTTLSPNPSQKLSR
jgi:hypothetical protein